MIRTYSKRTQGNIKLSDNFKVKEFACNDGSDLILIDDKLVEVLQSVRNYFHKPVKINSAYRTSAYNSRIGGSYKSQHTKGTAADIAVLGVNPIRVALYIASLPYFKNHGGIGVYSRSYSVTAGFVHVDTRESVSRWCSKQGTRYLGVSKIMPTLRKGAKDGRNGVGYAVTIMQRNIGVSADGIFGSGTQARLIEWQKEHGLTADGICGFNTWNAM